METSFSANPSEGYRDFPDRVPTDPPDDDAATQFSFATPKNVDVKVPPVEVTSYLSGGNAGGSDRPARKPYSTDGHRGPRAHYADDPAMADYDFDEEANSVFARDAGPSSSRRGARRKCYHRRTLAVCSFGFFLGIVAVAAFLLITKDSRSDSGGGAPSAGGIDLLNGGNIGMEDEAVKDRSQGAVGASASSEPETADINESNVGDPGAAEINEGDGMGESPASGNSEEASSGEAQSNNDAASDNYDDSDNANYGNELGAPGVVTAKAQQAYELLEGRDPAPNDSASEAADDEALPERAPAAANDGLPPGRDESRDESFPDAPYDESIPGQGATETGTAPGAADDWSLPGRDQARDESAAEAASDGSLPGQDESQIDSAPDEPVATNEEGDPAEEAPEAANDEPLPGQDESQNDSTPNEPVATDEEGGPAEEAPVAANDGPPPGQDESQNESTPDAPGGTDEEGDPAEEAPVAANAPAQQTAPDIAAPDGAPQETGREVVDITEFCGGCQWKNSVYTCNQRVQNTREHYGVHESEAKTTLMKQGHCPETVDFVAAVLDHAVIPSIDDCRKRPRPDDESLDNFCAACEWKGTDFNCYGRVSFLKIKYQTPERESMQALMDQGHCVDDRTEEEKQEAKEQGIEFWCGYCKFRAQTCQHRASGGGLLNGTQTLEAQLDLMAHDMCILPPYCDAMPST